MCLPSGPASEVWTRQPLPTCRPMEQSDLKPGVMDNPDQPQNARSSLPKQRASDWVGLVRFELTTPCSQSRCASQAAPQPEDFSPEWEIIGA